MLIEDNAQSPGMYFQGERCGTIGSMGVLSLNYHKGIQTGEGGVVLTDDDGLAERLQLIRNHGEVVVGKTGCSSIENTLGWNYRLTEIQAAIGTIQLKKLDKLNRVRSELAAILTEELERFEFLKQPVVEKECTHGYYLYPIKFNHEAIGISREVFVKAMQAEGISLGAGYVKPVYLEPMYQQQIAYGINHCPFKCPLYKGDVEYGEGLCPTAEHMHFSELMTTDICKYPNSEKEIHEFVSAVEKVASNADALSDLEREVS
jgi:dTDP-4-amino-4,6-dideoxygalactose transaminase